MSYAATISSAPIARRTIPVLAVALHVVALWLLVWSRVVHLPPPPSLPPAMEVELGELKASSNATPAPAIAEPPPTPPEPVPEPTPEPEPVPEPTPVVIPAPVELPKPPPKEVKPVDLPKPPPKEVVTPKPVVKPPEPKKSRVNSVADIRNREDYRPVVAQPRPAPVDVNKLANSLRAAAAGVSVSPTTSTSNSSTSASPSQTRDYQAALAAAMRTYWSEDFNASELTGSGRSALVQFVIRSDGTIASSRILRRSNVAAIDARAARAIQAVRSFPPPSDYGIRSTTYSVEFELTAKD